MCGGRLPDAGCALFREHSGRKFNVIYLGDTTAEQIFTKFCKYIPHLMGNQEKWHPEVYTKKSKMAAAAIWNSSFNYNSVNY
jgi:hypothetical protein